MVQFLIHASGCGTVLTLLALPEDQRDPALSEIAREAATAAITLGSAVPESSGPVAAASALRAAMPDITTFTDAERHLLQEWLDHLAVSQP